MSESAEIPECSRSFQSPCGPRPKLSPPAQLLQCNAPWPSYSRLRFALWRRETVDLHTANMGQIQAKYEAYSELILDKCRANIC